MQATLKPSAGNPPAAATLTARTTARQSEQTSKAVTGVGTLDSMQGGNRLIIALNKQAAGRRHVRAE